jgi:hypothetical protein
MGAQWDQFRGWELFAGKHIAEPAFAQCADFLLGERCFGLVLRLGLANPSPVAPARAPVHFRRLAGATVF